MRPTSLLALAGLVALFAVGSSCGTAADTAETAAIRACRSLLTRAQQTRPPDSAPPLEPLLSADGRYRVSRYVDTTRGRITYTCEVQDAQGWLVVSMEAVP